MGQQQLLLIVLGVILVGLAFLSGLTLWEYFSFQSTLDQLGVRGDYILNDAMKFFKTPVASGGGGNKSFAKWTPPKQMLADKYFIKSFNKNKTKGTATTATYYITTTLLDSKKANIPIQGSVTNKGVRTRTWYDSGKKKWYKF